MTGLLLPPGIAHQPRTDLESTSAAHLGPLTTGEGSGTRSGAVAAVADTGGADDLSDGAINSLEQFQAFSTSAGDLVANGRVVKFLIDLRKPQPDVHFINGNYRSTSAGPPPEARYHYLFARAALAIPETLEQFNEVTYFQATKRYVAGAVRTYHLTVPGVAETAPLYAIQFYPQDVISEDAVAVAVLAVRDRIHLDVQVAFVATGVQQTVARVTQQLEQADVRVLTLDRILGSITYLPLNVGEAWGHLRIFPANPDALLPSDIAIFDELPLDLSVVAGVLTRSVQDTSSHVNLKSKERNTPNGVLRDAGPNHPQLASLADRPAHLIVGRDRLVLEPASEEEVASHLAARLVGPTFALEWDSTPDVVSLDDLAAGTTTDTLQQARRYGGKAANLAFLSHSQVLGRAADRASISGRVGYDLVPRGIAVPFQIYRDFVDHPPNGELRDLLAGLIEDERRGQLSPQGRAERVATLQTAFMAATFPPEAWTSIRQALAAVLPNARKVKVRSSANAEDVPNFDGAGLHDSFGADLGKPAEPERPCRFHDASGGVKQRRVKPKSLLCAVQGVYASLWNKRAIEERTFAHIDHTSVAMGLVIVPAYDSDAEIAANAVVVTRILNTDEVFGYTLSVQQHNNLVTNPDPGTYSEMTVAAFLSRDEPVSLTVTRYAKPEATAAERTTTLLSPDQMVDLVNVGRHVETQYCSAKPSYYPGGTCQAVPADSAKPTSLDLELKLLDNGQIVCKQAREFGGR